MSQLTCGHIQHCTPDDGWDCHPKHVKPLRIKNAIVASCWNYFTTMWTTVYDMVRLQVLTVVLLNVQFFCDVIVPDVSEHTIAWWCQDETSKNSNAPTTHRNIRTTSVSARWFIIFYSNLVVLVNCTTLAHLQDRLTNLMHILFLVYFVNSACFGRM